MSNMSLTFTQWNLIIPFTIVAHDGGSADSLITTIAVKSYKASVSEISTPFSAMCWIRWSFTRCYVG